jgi:hypothetical protein
MRDQLRPLESQLVVIKGRITEKQKQADGTIAICLAAVEVRPHRIDRPLRDVPPVRCDHLWIRGLDADDVDFRGMLRSMSGVGRVSYYRRGNGTVDLGIKAVAGICLDSISNRLEAEPQQGNRVRLMARTVERIEEGCPYWCWAERADMSAANLIEAMNRYHRNMAMNLGALLVAPSTGPCTRMKAADPFSSLRNSDRSRKGFAQLLQEVQANG